MNRKNFLILHNFCADTWAERYGLEPFEYPCKQCDRIFVTAIPFAKGEFRGLIASVCKCGNADTPFCLVRDPKKGDLLWRSHDET